MAAAQPAGKSGVGGRALRAGSLLAGATVVERLMRLGRNMLLARVIAPDQFGMMALVLAVLALLEALTEVGVAQAVIQNERGGTREFLNVAWWFGILRGLVVGVIALPLAGPVASFYDTPELASLLMVAPLTVVFTGLTSPRVYALQREFRFGATLVSLQGAGLLGTAATIALGLWLQNVWALLIGAVLESALRFVLSFVVAPFRPSLRWEAQSRRDLLRFTRGMAGLSLLTLLIMQADVFVLGRTGTVDDLGLYTMAIALASLPLTIFSKVAQPIVVPVLTRLQDDLPGMRLTVLRMSRLVWLFGLPLAAIMGVVGGELLTVVYGRPEFSRMATPFAIYAVFVVVYMASMVTFSVYLSIGRPELQRRFTLVRAAFVLVLLYPMAAHWGAAGAVAALSVSMVGGMVVQLARLRSVIGLPVLDYLRTPLPGLVAAATTSLALTALVMLTDTGGPLLVGIAILLGGATWSVLLLRERHEVRKLHATAGQPVAESRH